MNALFFSLFEDISHLDIEKGKLIHHTFPDGETYLRFESELKGRDIVLLDSLNQANEKFLPLVFAAKTAKALECKSVTLAAPYLAYMRQDKAFKTGECISSKYFAGLISDTFDRLVTIDPHLHRYHHLNEIYTIPTRVIHANKVIQTWLASNINKPVLIGPDSESAQWVKDIAAALGAPYIILEKTRAGDYTVEIERGEIAQYKDYSPILVDDIISTGTTMLATIALLKDSGFRAPTCIAVHAIFADDAYKKLLDAGAENVISCNTIKHESNQLDVLSDLLSALR